MPPAPRGPPSARRSKLVADAPVALVETLFCDPVDDDYMMLQLFIPPDTISVLLKRSEVPVYTGRIIRAYGVGGKGKLNLV
jgi:hypothetical protein